jgi:DNA-binding transcriptional regulator YiaG
MSLLLEHLALIERNRHVPTSVRRDIDVRDLRRRLGMSQKVFARRFGLSQSALRHWEHGERRPSGAALTLLNVIDRLPRAVLVALEAPIPRTLEFPRSRWQWEAVERALLPTLSIDGPWPKFRRDLPPL